jgi:hypothetical protein
LLLFALFALAAGTAIILGMRAFLSEVFLFLWGPSNHPIYRRETAGWAYVRAWRGLRKGCLPLIGLVMVGVSCCCGSMIMPMILEESTSAPLLLILVIPGIVWFGITAGAEVVNGLTGLVATVLTATSISAEIEADTYALLRLTPIPPSQIVAAKLGAAFAQLRLPVITVMISRLISVVGGILLLIFYTIVISNSSATSSGTPSAALPVIPSISPEVLSPLFIPIVVGVLIWLIAGVIWLLYYAIAKPFLDILLFLSVGLFASSLARTRSSGLFVAGGLRVVLWVASYVGSQAMSSALSIFAMPLVILSANGSSSLDQLLSAHPGLVMIGGAVAAIVSAIVLGAIELGFALLLVNITQGRARRLPFAGA